MSTEIPGPGYGPLEGAVENHGTQTIGSAGRPAKDRAIELAEALSGNPWVESSTREVCRALLSQWKKETKP